MHRIILLSLFSCLPMMGFQPSKRFITFVSKQTYPKHQKQLPGRLQDVATKHQAEQTKKKVQEIKNEMQQQQKEKSK